MKICDKEDPLSSLGILIPGASFIFPDSFRLGRALLFLAAHLFFTQNFIPK